MQQKVEIYSGYLRGIKFNIKSSSFAKTFRLHPNMPLMGTNYLFCKIKPQTRTTGVHFTALSATKFLKKCFYYIFSQPHTSICNRPSNFFSFFVFNKPCD